MSFDRTRNASVLGELLVADSAPTGSFLHPAATFTGVLAPSGFFPAVTHWSGRVINDPGETIVVGDPFTVATIVPDVIDVPESLRDQGDAPPL